MGGSQDFSHFPSATVTVQYKDDNGRASIPQSIIMPAAANGVVDPSSLSLGT